MIKKETKLDNFLENIKSFHQELIITFHSNPTCITTRLTLTYVIPNNVVFTIEDIEKELNELVLSNLKHNDIFVECELYNVSKGEKTELIFKKRYNF